MRPFNYDVLFTGVTRASPVMEVEMSLRSPSLAKPALAFISNLKRAATFASMPAHIAYSVRRDQLFSDCATLRSTGKLEPDLRQFIDSDPTAQFKEEFTALASAHFANVRTREQVIDLAEGLGVGYIERFLDGNLPMQESMDAVFEAVILQSWTGFECLAGDLWIAAVDNDKGEIIAKLIHSGRKLANPDDNIRPETVYRAGINPRTQYGSFLKAIKAVSFQTLGNIRKYYGIALGREFTDLFDAIDDGYIEVLSAFRNSIAHNGGMVDRHFLSQIAPFAEFRALSEGDKLQLEGNLVLRLRNVSVLLGRALLDKTDNFLASQAQAT